MDDVRAAVGIADIVGAGRGWQAAAYGGRGGACVACEVGPDGLVSGFRPIDPRASVSAVPEGVPGTEVGSVPTSAFLLEDGRFLAGAETGVLENLRGVLASSPALVGPLTAASVSLQCGDPALIEAAHARAWRLMQEFSRTSGEVWRSTTLSGLLGTSLAVLPPGPADGGSRGPRSEARVRVVGGHVRFVVHGDTWETTGGLGCPTPAADAVLRGLGLERMGFADGGSRPWAWHPAGTLVMEGETFA